MPALPVEKPYSKTRAEPVPEALRLRALERIAHYIELARSAWPRAYDPLPMPTCSFDLRGHTAGAAIFGTKENRQVLHVRLNAYLLCTQPDEVLRTVIPHEVAHLVVYHLHGRDVEGHGVEWQRVMRSFGQDPNVRHVMPTKAARVVERPFEYRCACQTYWFTARRHGKPYRCSKCGAMLRYVGDAVRIVLPAPPSKLIAPPAPSTLSPMAAPTSVRTSPPAAAAGGKAQEHLPPTEKQLEFAQELAQRLQCRIPAPALLDRRLLSTWIEQALAKTHHPR